MKRKPLLLTILVMALFVGLLTVIHFYPMIGITILVGTGSLMFAYITYTAIDAYVSKNDIE
jgi:hypothetical protein